MSFELTEGFGGYDEDRVDHLVDTGVHCAADARAAELGYRDDAEDRATIAALAQRNASTIQVTETEPAGHVCTGNDATCYPGGKPNGPQACGPIMAGPDRVRLRNGYTLASAVLRGDVDWRDLPEL